MSRTVSNTLKSAIYAPQTDEVFIVLLTLSHADLANDIRVTSDAVTTVSNGMAYLPFPFMISLPEDSPDRLSQVTLTIDAVERTIITALRSITSPPTVTMRIVLASDPDTTELGDYDFTLRQAEYDASSVRGELYFEDILNEPYPAHSFVPSDYAGLF